MDDMRGSLSKMKKKLNRLTGGKRKPDGMTANPDEERTDSTSLPPQPKPHVVAGESYDREGDRVNIAGERVFSTDPPPQPARGGDNGQEGLGSGHSGELEGVNPSPSTPSISHGRKLDST